MAYMKSVSTNDGLLQEFETEFEDLVIYILGINQKTEDAFKGTNTLNVDEVIKALIQISGINSDIDKNLRIICLKVIRKVVELEARGQNSPAAQWDPDDWE